MNTIEFVFSWLLTATVRASILVVVVLGIQFILRHRLPAAWRYALWLPVLAVLVLPVLPEVPFGLPLKLTQTAVVAPAPFPTDASPSKLVLADSSHRAESPAILPNRRDSLHFFSLVWLVGACGVLVTGVVGYHRAMRRFRSTAAEPQAKLKVFIAEAAEKAGLKGVPKTLVSPDVASPAVTGFLRPVLLLPINFPVGLSAVEARLILLHEFIHLKRFDLPLNWLLCVLQAMHWFNPLLWWAFARMRADREVSCDARVLSIDSTDHRSEYGGALLKLKCIQPSHFLSLGFVGIFERSSEIKSRLQGIARHRPDCFRWKVAGAAILGLLMVFGVTNGQQPAPFQPVSETDATVQPAAAQTVSGRDRIQQKLDSIIIPRINFNDATPADAIQFLGQQSQALDLSETDPTKKGVNFVLQVPDSVAGEAPASPKISLQLQNVPLAVALQLVCNAAGLNYVVEDSFVSIIPGGKADLGPAAPEDSPARRLLQNKVDSIIIPRLELKDLTVVEAINFVREYSRQLDTAEKDPLKRGVNLVLELPEPALAEQRITALQLQNVTLAATLQAICKGRGLAYTVDDHVVIISAKGE